MKDILTPKEQVLNINFGDYKDLNELSLITGDPVDIVNLGRKILPY